MPVKGTEKTENTGTKGMCWKVAEENNKRFAVKETG